MARAIAIALICACARLGAQQLELRSDVLGPRPYTVSAGAGLVKAFGYYARGSADVSYGMRRVADTYVDEWRGDLLARFLFDPFREERWGLSFGGGLSIRRRTYIALVMDLEGPATRGVVPAVQLGVSGGWRAGIVLRRAVRGRR